MIMRFSLSAALIAVLATSACAREADSDDTSAGTASGSGDAGIERLVQDVAPEGGAAVASLTSPTMRGAPLIRRTRSTSKPITA